MRPPPPAPLTSWVRPHKGLGGLLGKREGEGGPFHFFPTHPRLPFHGTGPGSPSRPAKPPRGALALTGWPGLYPVWRGEWEGEEGGVLSYLPPFSRGPIGLSNTGSFSKKRGGFPSLSGYSVPRPSLLARIRLNHSLLAAS